MNFDVQVMIETIFIVFGAVPRTFLMAVLILLVGILVGGLLALIKIRRVPVLTQLINVLISYVRGVPLIVHLFVIMSILPDAASSFLNVFGLGMAPHEFPSVLIVLFTYSMLESAVQSENIRGALQSIDPKQIEAGLSIGFTRQQTLRRVIIPQALAVALPLFLNALLKIIKGLSLAFTVGAVDILATARFAAALNFRYLESYVAAALVYWLICGVLLLVFNRIELRLQVGRTR